MRGTRIYNISGFIDPARGLFATRASWKLLQQPRRFSIGLAFESAFVDDAAALKLRDLLTTAGFHGIFEAEFVPAEGRLLLLDLNPRIYNGMALAEAQGMNLALAWYHAALGDWAKVEDSLGPPRRSAGLAHPFLIRTTAATALVSGRMTPSQALGWERWLRRTRPVHAVAAPDDPWPGRLDTFLHLSNFVRHPRAFAGTFLKD